MRSRWLLIAITLLLLVLACRSLAPAVQESPSPTPIQPTATFSPVPTPLPTSTPLSPTDSPTAPRVQPTPSFTPLPEASFTVRLHPDGLLYVGDQVSFEVIAAPQISLAGGKARLALASHPDQPLGEADFASYGIGGRTQATLYWVWDTAGLQPGDYDLDFSVLPDGPTWTETVSLLPANQVPPPEPEAAWQTAESDCCLVHYITGTDAERDLDTLLTMVDEQAALASQRIGVEIDETLPISFLPRVLGHGGFTAQEISVSYLDRNYAGDGTEIVLHHELIHALDNRRETDFKPSLLVEGLAVYLTGGHFKPEPLMERAAALLPPGPDCPINASTAEQPVCGLGWYLPLTLLVDNFYHSQHEIGYLQAGALVEFMVETWGWEAFDRFYTGIQQPQESTDPALDESLRQDPSRLQSQALEAALGEHFGISLQDLETVFLEVLGQIPLSQADVDDVRLTVMFFDTLRRYQLALDPSAHFLAAWLPDSQQMRQQGIVADYLRHPSSQENIALESLLVQADAALRRADYARAEELLQSVNRTLADVEARQAYLQTLRMFERPYGQ